MSVLCEQTMTHDRAQGPQGGFGISAAVATPFNIDFTIDDGLLALHARRLLEEGCSSITLFGTTGEGPSIAMRERAAAHEVVLRSGIQGEQIVMGIGAPALETAVEQAETALRLGCKWFLVMPPFYFKDISDEGLFAWYEALVRKIAVREPRIILYHIPQVTSIAISPELIRRLRESFGEIIMGVKDSGGDWSTTTAFLAQSDIAVLIGDERHLAAAAQLGCSGAISGMANQFPGLLADILGSGRENPALNSLIDALVQHPVTPGIKAVIGAMRKEETWSRVRPPLQATPLPIAAKLAKMASTLT